MTSARRIIRCTNLARLAVTAGLVVAVAATTGCEDDDPNAGHPDPVINVPDAFEGRLAEARQEAIDRWPEYAAAFARPQGRRFATKHPFDTSDGGVEYLWITTTRIDGDELTGVIDNIPVADIGYDYGDEVSRPITDLHDWIIATQTPDGEVDLTGGFSLPIVLEAERANED